MKFHSKINNYRLLLTPNVPGDPYRQIPAVHGKSVKFNDGLFETEDEEIITLLKKNKGLNKDFFAEEVDPFATQRQQREPIHDLMDLASGRPGEMKSSAVQSSQTPEGKIQEMVKAMAMQILEEGGYVKAEPDQIPDSATEPSPTSAYDPDEMMDTGLRDAGEIPVLEKVDEQLLEENPDLAEAGVEVGAKIEEVEAPAEVPQEIKADTKSVEDDGINPLASTLPEELKKDSSEKKSDIETKKVKE